MILNCIWWRGFSSGDLLSGEYPYITITPKFTLLGWVKHIYFKNYKFWIDLVKPYVCKEMIIIK